MDAAMTASRWTVAAGHGAGQRWHVRGHLFVFSALLAGWVALMAACGAHAAEGDAAPYQYELGPELTATELGDLAPLLPPGIVVRSARVRAPEQHQVLAQVRFAEAGPGRVLMDWQAQVDDPFLTLLPPPAEMAVLAPVLARHVPDGATVLAWWDVSRQVRLLTGAEVAFFQPLGEPLFVPVRWREQTDAVADVERVFWRMPDAAALRAQREQFQRFVAALLAPEQEGVAALRALGEGKPVVLVLHLRDLILLGQMVPEKLGVAFRDFGSFSEVHGMIQRVRAWMRENDYSAYGLLQDASKPVRAVALTDAASGQTLVARLLPLVGNEQGDVAGAKLVYRTGGYIVFEIDADDAPKTTDPS